MKGTEIGIMIVAVGAVNDNTAVQWTMTAVYNDQIKHW